MPLNKTCTPINIVKTRIIILIKLILNDQKVENNISAPI